MKTFDACPLIGNCALDIICNCAMGYNLDAQLNAANSTYIWAIKHYSEITNDRFVNHLLSLNKDVNCIKEDYVYVSSSNLNNGMTPFSSYSITRNTMMARNVSRLCMTLQILLSQSGKKSTSK